MVYNRKDSVEVHSLQTPSLDHCHYSKPFRSQGFTAWSELKSKLKGKIILSLPKAL